LVIGLYELLDPTTYLIEPSGPPNEIRFIQVSQYIYISFI